LPIEYTVDRERRLVITTPRGRVTPEEMFVYQRELWARPEVAGYDELVEMPTDLEIERDTVDNVERLASLAVSMDDMNGPARTAILAETDYHYAMGRMYKSFRELHPHGQRRVEVFRSRDDAMAWLEAPTAPE